MSNHFLRDKTAIIGVGATPQGRIPGSTQLSLAVDAFKAAIGDAGIDKSEIDCLLTFPGTTAPEGELNYLRLGEALGINPKVTGSMSLGGCTAGALVEMAAQAIATGMATTAAVVFGDAAKTGGSRFSRASGWGDPWSLWGMYGACANSAISASRHMALYGTTSEQLAEVAVSGRYHASLNPDAVMRTPITVEEHQASRWIVEPLHLLDCCLISDGGVCIILTSAERARETKQPPVFISGMGQAHTSSTLAEPDWWYVPHQKRAVQAAYEMAGVGPSDIDTAQLYDNFTISVLLWLEHAGFCDVGEGGSYVEGGRLQLGGPMPVNTAGGNLSESYMEGWLHIVEAVRQLRGTSGERQVADAEVALVTGRGMTLNCSNAMILTKDGV